MKLTLQAAEKNDDGVLVNASTQWQLHTHDRFTALLEYVRDHPSEQVTER